MTTDEDEFEDIKVVTALMKGVVSTLEMLIDREFAMTNIRAERAHERPAGAGGVHISFRFGFLTSAGVGEGSMIVPLPDALAIAAYLMCVPDVEVKTHRASREPDEGLKDALLEVGNMTAAAIDDAVRGLCGPDSKVKFLGCQGVKSDVRPAFKHTGGDELVVGRATSRIHDYPEFELILILPELRAKEATSA